MSGIPDAAPVEHDDIIAFPYLDDETPIHRNGDGWGLLIDDEPVAITATGDHEWELVFPDGGIIRRRLDDAGEISDEHLPPDEPQLD